MHTSDQVLVTQASAGDRQAFAEIVGRYQTLVCSVAYGATGNLAASEELAHEAFIAAWASIRTLKDPCKLRPWLCGIVRNLASNRTRKRQRDILSNASAIEQTQFADDASDPVESSIAREEADLLDRTLAGMPETYREPLVLFYREQQSVSRVAELLELTPSAVKQRLARGRDMLRTEVAAIVERGLLQSSPGRAFTIGVLAALPVMSGSAKAATVTATTVKGVGAMKAAGLMGVLGMIIGPLAGALGAWFGYSMSMKSARSDQERDFVRRMARWIIGLIVFFGAAMGLLLYFGQTLSSKNPNLLAYCIAALALGYVATLSILIVGSNRQLARIREADTDISVDEVVAKLPPALGTLQYARIYESSSKLLGVPLVSVRFHGAGAVSKAPRPAVGWVAIGDKAYGVLFACGSLAVGGIACGAVSIGLISFGGFSIGALALGGAALGWWSTGGVALGWVAFGGVALAWKAAVGGMALSQEFALGGLIVGSHTNDEVAKAYFESSRFFQMAGRLMSPWGWWIVVAVALMPMLIALKLVPPTETSEAAASDAD